MPKAARWRLSHSVFCATNDDELQRIVTNPCPKCGADRTFLYIDPKL